MNKQDQYCWNSPQPGRPQDRWEGLLFVEEIQLRNKQTIKQERRRGEEMKRKYLKPKWTICDTFQRELKSRSMHMTFCSRSKFRVLQMKSISYLTDYYSLPFVGERKILVPITSKTYWSHKIDISLHLYAISLVKGLKSDKLSKRAAVCPTAELVKNSV